MGIKDGGPAFPLPGGAGDYTVQVTHLGMSLRDYFAGLAIPRLLGLALQLESNGRLKEDATVTVAKLAFQIADAMLAEREKAK